MGDGADEGERDAGGWWAKTLLRCSAPIAITRPDIAEMFWLPMVREDYCPHFVLGSLSWLWQSRCGASNLQ